MKNLRGFDDPHWPRVDPGGITEGKCSFSVYKCLAFLYMVQFLSTNIETIQILEQL